VKRKLHRRANHPQHNRAKCVVHSLIRKTHERCHSQLIIREESKGMLYRMRMIKVECSRNRTKRERGKGGSPGEKCTQRMKIPSAQNNDDKYFLLSSSLPVMEGNRCCRAQPSPIRGYYPGCPDLRSTAKTTTGSPPGHRTCGVLTKLHT
jgi:hypothetical protein